MTSFQTKAQPGRRRKRLSQCPNTLKDSLLPDESAKSTALIRQFRQLSEGGTLQDLEAGINEAT